MAESGTASIEIHAVPEAILEVVRDIESYPDWMDAFKEATILETDSDGRPLRAEFEVDARIKTVRYVLDYVHTENSISWKLASGDLNELTGGYALEPAGDDTNVTYEYSIDPGFPIPGFLRKQAVKLMVSSALGDLKNRVES